MEDETQIFEKAKPPVEESRIMNVSMRGWIALIVVLTVCAMSVMNLEIREPLYTLAGMVVGFYFAQQKQKPHETAGKVT